ncbi:hypothetical protein IWX49DRAFT_43673 [Phyllosticta citricarpa]
MELYQAPPPAHQLSPTSLSSLTIFNRPEFSPPILSTPPTQTRFFSIAIQAVIMSSHTPNQQNNGRQMAPVQPAQIRPFGGSGREDLVSKLEALALNHTNPAARVFEPSTTTRTPHAHPLLQHPQQMYPQTQQQQQQQHLQSIGPIGQPTTTSAAPLYTSVASSHFAPAASSAQYDPTASSSHYAPAASTPHYVPTAASAAAAANAAAAAAAAAANYQRHHIIKCGRCYGEMKPSVSFHGWLGHCAHGRSFAPHELDYQVCGCNLAFMTAFEMETHLRSHGCDQRR